jgi:lipoprotein-anchoring transpeptidase ErfK/SrfK
VAAAAAAPSVARADLPVVPPWVDANDVPAPTWARSVAPNRPDTAIAGEAGHPEDHRGVADPRALLPLYGVKRDAACGGRWLLVGPMAWICSDAADFSAELPRPAPSHRGEDGLPFRYFFAGQGGAETFLNEPAGDDSRGAGVEAPEATLDPGFAVGVSDERTVAGTRWLKTSHGLWIAASELVASRPSPFQGEEIAGALDVAWVVADTAAVYAEPAPRGKPSSRHARFERVAWREERPAPNGGGVMVRVSEDGRSPAEWMRARDLAHPALSAPPVEVEGPAVRWIDVDVSSQTLVAYEGTKPVFATLVSTGREEGMTPLGVRRIWVKILATDMEDLASDDSADPSDRYSIEDVPYVQYFDKGVALHGAFWHRDFGRRHSHGCVNLAPKDAAWLFGFTAPHLPAGWDAVYPTPLEPGTLVRVRVSETATVRAARAHSSPGERVVKPNQEAR